MKRKEKELEQERLVSERLRRVDQLKDDFLANVSHELRTPLQGIIGITESLRDGVAGQPTEKMEQNYFMIISSGRRLTSLVNDILDFSKLKKQDLKRPDAYHSRFLGKIQVKGKTSAVAVYGNLRRGSGKGSKTQADHHAGL